MNDFEVSYKLNSFAHSIQKFSKRILFYKNTSCRNIFRRILYSEAITYFRHGKLINDEKEFALFKDFERIFTGATEYSSLFPARIDYDKIVEVMQILGIHDEVKEQYQTLSSQSIRLINKLCNYFILELSLDRFVKPISYAIVEKAKQAAVIQPFKLNK